MELLIMLLLPLPIGFFIKNAMAGYVTYIAVHGFAFTFQTLYLILGWIGGDSSAFGTYPNPDGADTIAYGVVNLAIFLAGLGLVWLGQYLATRRRRPSEANSGPLTTAGVDGALSSSHSNPPA